STKPTWCATIWCSASYAPTTSTRRASPSSSCFCWRSPGMRTRPAQKSRRRQRRRQRGRHRPKPRDSVRVHFGRGGRDRPSCLILCRIAKREGRQKPLVILEKQVAGLNEGLLKRFIARARKAVGLNEQVN